MPEEQNEADEEGRDGQRRDSHDGPTVPIAGCRLAEAREHERHRGGAEGLLEGGRPLHVELISLTGLLVRAV